MVTNKEELRKYRSRGSTASRIIKIGLDVHAAFTMVVERHDGETPKPGRKMNPGQLLEHLAGLVAAGYEVHTVYEACSLGFTLHRRMAEMGVHSLVITPILLNDRAARRKNDRMDARALCQRLDRFRGRKQVGSFTGGCPSEHSTGGRQRFGCIDRHGNPRNRCRFNQQSHPP